MYKVLRNWELIVVTQTKKWDIFYWYSKEAIKPVKNEAIVAENEKDGKSIDELKELLKNANIKFFAWANYETLLKKCEENKLI